MDELTAVAQLRNELPDNIDLTGAQRRLRTEISATATVTGRSRQTRPRRGRGLRIVALGAVAAAVAVAVVIAQNGTAHPPRTAIRPATTLAVSRAELVAYATKAAAAQPAFDPRPHQWIYTETLQAASSAGAGGYLYGPPNRRVIQKTWRRVDGMESAYLQHGKLRVGQSNLPSPVHGNANPVPTPIGWPSTSYPYLESLPTNPASLTALIKANLKAEPDPIGADGHGNVGVFNAIQVLMENVVLPPKLRAGLYGALAADPAVHFDRSVTDLAGRTGVAFYTIQEGYLKDEIVINPHSYAYMGYQDVAIRSHTSAGLDGTAHFHKGQILGWQALLQSGIVSHPGQLP